MPENAALNDFQGDGRQNVMVTAYRRDTHELNGKTHDHAPDIFHGVPVHRRTSALPKERRMQNGKISERPSRSGRILHDCTENLDVSRDEFGECECESEPQSQSQSRGFRSSPHH